MPVLPNNTDPLDDYVSGNITPALTSDGLVYNQIYAQTGVIDSLNNTSVSNYADPNFNTTNQSNGLLSFNPQTATYWLSNTDFGGPSSQPIVITYNLSNTTYYNSITMSVLNVPCYVELLDQNMNALPGASTFTIAGGSDIFTTTDWSFIEYNAPTNITSLNSANNTTFTYPLTGTTAVNVRITRNKTVQSANSQNVLYSVAYSVGIENFRIKLNIQQTSDIPSVVVSGTANMIVQNRLGFVENYSFVTNATSNMFQSISGTNYWRSAPQPVKDSIVYFYAELSDPTPTVINRFYIDPLYSGCRFNVYYSTNTTSGNTIDPGNFTWTPIQSDFTLRKGIYEIPRTSATYLKFEFTQLQAEVYDLPFDSIDRTINVFPLDVEQYYSNLEQEIIDGNAVKYSTIGNSNIGTQGLGTSSQNTNQLTASTIFGLSTSTVSNNSWPALAALNDVQQGTSLNGISSSVQIIDPSTSYKLLDSNGNYNNNSYTDFLYRRFPNTRVHQYNQVTINQTWHQAYFVGIRYINAFYETVYDDLRGTPGNLISRNGTTSGFSSGYPSDINYVGLSPDETATTPFFNTIDAFTSFNIGGLTTDWRSFLTQGNPIQSDPTLLNKLSNYTISTMVGGLNSTMTLTGTLGKSTIYSVAPITSGSTYGVQSSPYQTGNNVMNYNDANFLTTSGWVAGSGTTVTSAVVSWSGYSGSSTSPSSGTSSGILVSGGSNTVTYNFTLPNVFDISGATPYTTQLGSASLGVVGYASYAPTSGMSYYFLTNLQSSGTTNVTMTTRFINSTTSGVISGTTVTGSTVNLTAASGFSIITATGASYNASIPSNTVQVVLSGTASGVPYEVYQAGAFTTPTNIWISPTDRNNMRVSGVARMFLPNTNIGSYRVSLYAVSSTNVQTEIAYKTYTANQLPLNSWFDVQLNGYTIANYTSFFIRVVQTNTAVTEKFYLSMLAPFYHPVRYEYRNNTSSSYRPIAVGINDPNYFISNSLNVPSSGIQIRMTALDPNVYIAGVSVIPQYRQNPYYANLNIDYQGTSKTNELPVRTSIENKPYFQLNKNVYPSEFSLDNIAGTIIPYSVD